MKFFFVVVVFFFLVKVIGGTWSWPRGGREGGGVDTWVLWNLLARGHEFFLGKDADMIIMI